MPNSIRRSFEVVFCTAKRDSDQPNRIPYAFIANSDAKAISAMRTQYRKSSRGFPYYWIESFDEVIAGKRKAMMIPNDIVESRIPDPNEQPPLPAA